MFPWKKVALSTIAGVMLVALMLYMQTKDIMLLVLGAVVAGVLGAMFGLAWLLIVGLRGPPSA